MRKKRILRRLRSRKVKLISCIIAGTIALFSISFSIGQSLYTKSNTIEDKSVFKIENAETESSSINSEIIIYDNLEVLSGDIIEARTRNENIDFVSKEKLQAIRSIVQKMGYGDRGYILNVLDRWEKGNYSLVLEEHNYFHLRLKDNNIETD